MLTQKINTILIAIIKYEIWSRVQTLSMYLLGDCGLIKDKDSGSTI